MSLVRAEQLVKTYRTGDMEVRALKVGIFPLNPLPSSHSSGRREAARALYIRKHRISANRVKENNQR